MSQQTGFEIRYAQNGVDCVCMECMKEKEHLYQGDQWKPVYWTDKDAGCGYCGRPMTQDMV